MDAETQPLLNHTIVVTRCRLFRPLSHAAVIDAQNDVSWRRARFSLVLIFWAVMAILLCIITCILVTTTKCRPYDVDVGLIPSVPPVHMSFTPLVSSGRAVYNNLVYTM